MEGSLAPLMRTLNELRRRHDGVFSLRDIRFHHSDDESFLVYTRGHADDDLLLCVVNLDPWNPRETMVRSDLGAVGLSGGGGYNLVDELTDEHYEWHGDAGFVRLDPSACQAAHVLSVTRSGCARSPGPFLTSGTARCSLPHHIHS